jgi:oligoendopeptidase F
MSETTYQQTRWSLDALFPGPNSPELEKAFQQIDQQIGEFETLRPKLTPELSADSFKDFLERIESIQNLASRIYVYAGLLFYEDTQNQTAQTLRSRVEQFVADMTNRMLFFDLWWKGLEEDQARRLLAEAGDLQYWLEAMRHFKPHTLSEAEEKIINIKNVTGLNALQMLYNSITNRYTYKLTVDGQEKELTRGELMVFVRGADPDLRAGAYRELYRVYGADAPILGQIYQALVRDWRNEQVNLRKYPAPISARNLINDLPDTVVDTLLEVSKKNVDIFQRFFRLKARWLGMDRLRRYDIYAPVDQSSKEYPFEKGVHLVLDSFQNFDPLISDLARRVFAENRLDSEIRKGKRSGAFCWGAVPELTPWVLLNYQGHAEDVSTMAHELGHAIHSMLASGHSILTWHSNLPLAETASTFGEMLLVDRLLAEESDERVRRDLIFKQMDDAYATILRQVFFALFEREAHEMIHAGASVDDLADAYMKNLAGQFGDAVELSDEFRWEWVSIPHIYDVPFYVYAYAFGQLLVLSLYKQYKAEGEAFKPRYLKILSTGGARAPIALLSEAGIDVSQPAFWQGGFDVLNDLVSQLEALPVSR